MLLRVIIGIIFCASLCSCQHKVSRIGYTLEKDQREECEVAIQRFVDVNSNEAKEVGKIKLTDTGFSTSCNESKAIEILKGEACALMADLVVITSQREPDIGSSCYRCEATFYKIIDGSSKLANIPKTDLQMEKDIESRDLARKKKNKQTFWTSFAVGFLIGFIAVSL